MRGLQVPAIFMVIFGLLGCDGYRPSTSEQVSLKQCQGFAKNSYGQQLYWQPKFPIKITINKSFPNEYVEELENALKQWNEATQFEVFVFDSEKDQSVSSREDSKNVVYWMTEWSENKKDLQASTNLYWSGQETREADILLNAKYFKISVDPKDDEIDLQSLLVHELGHIFGLGHIDEKSSVMISKLGLGEKRRQPSESDVKNLSCRY